MQNAPASFYMIMFQNLPKKLNTDIDKIYKMLVSSIKKISLVKQNYITE